MLGSRSLRRHLWDSNRSLLHILYESRSWTLRTDADSECMCNATKSIVRSHIQPMKVLFGGYVRRLKRAPP